MLLRMYKLYLIYCTGALFKLVYLSYLFYLNSGTTSCREEFLRKEEENFVNIFKKYSRKLSLIINADITVDGVQSPFPAELQRRQQF